MLSDRCPVLSVCLSLCFACDVRALWPNGWMDQDETWRAGRPRSWSHCVRWVPSSPPQRAQPPFSAHICCGQMTGLIKMPLGKEVGLGPDDIVRWGPSHRRKGHSSPPLFGPCLLWPCSPILATVQLLSQTTIND